MTRASPLFTRAAIIFFAAFIAIYILTFFDARLLYGVSVWEKPSKFLLSLSLHMATLAWGISLLPPGQQHSKSIRRATLIFLAAAMLEMAYIMVQSMRGEASHFNRSTPLHSILYAVMGVGAVTLTAVTGYLGWRIRRGPASTLQFAAGWGFIASAIATTLVAGTLSSGASHWIGGDQTDATGLPFFHWSTTGGDLRAAHFAALHIMQAVPLVAWFWNSRRLSLAALGGGVVLVGLLAAQALMGIPLLRV
jgi:hypothetical protein